MCRKAYHVYPLDPRSGSAIKGHGKEKSLCVARFFGPRVLRSFSPTNEPVWNTSWRVRYGGTKLDCPSCGTVGAVPQAAGAPRLRSRVPVTRLRRLRTPSCTTRGRRSFRGSMPCICSARRATASAARSCSASLASPTRPAYRIGRADQEADREAPMTSTRCFPAMSRLRGQYRRSRAQGLRHAAAILEARRSLSGLMERDGPHRLPALFPTAKRQRLRADRAARTLSAAATVSTDELLQLRLTHRATATAMAA